MLLFVNSLLRLSRIAIFSFLFLCVKYFDDIEMLGSRNSFIVENAPYMAKCMWLAYIGADYLNCFVYHDLV